MTDCHTPVASVPTGDTDAVGINCVVAGDSCDLLAGVAEASVDLILSDIPYGIGLGDWDVLHDNRNSAYLGASPAQARAGAVFKTRGKPLNGWSEADRRIPHEYYEWCSSWAPEWLRVLKPGASAFVFAGRRLGHRCIAALEDAGFTYKDSLAWIRPHAVHRAQRLAVVYGRRGDEVNADAWEGWRLGNLRPSFEPIFWFTKPYPIGTTIADNVLIYGVGGYNEEAYLRYVDRPDNILEIGFAVGETGLHPAQKPIRLMGALIELTTSRGQLVLDPFTGSGSTLVAAQGLGRDFLGFELSERYVNICRMRLANAAVHQHSLFPH